VPFRIAWSWPLTDDDRATLLATVALVVAALVAVRWLTRRIRQASPSPSARAATTTQAALPSSRELHGPLEQQIEVVGRHLMAVLRDGRLHLARFGAAERDPAARFELGAVTQLLTALAAHDVVSSGHLAWEQPVRELLPEAFRTLADSDTTLLQLATHTAGLPSLPKFWTERTPSIEHLLATISRTQVCQAFVRDEGRTPLRARQVRSSDHGFALLGLLLEEATQVDYETVVTHTVLQPLRVEDTVVTLDAERLPALVTRRAVGAQPLSRVVGSGLGGALGFTSTIDDMGQLLLSATTPPADDSTRAPAWAATWSPMEPLAGVHALTGWREELHVGGTRVVLLDGALSHSAATIAISPERALGIVLLVAGATEQARSAARLLLERVVAAPFAPAREAVSH
jgi:serine-type D-Ala-D-Ala carboxypeptidase/endopeptidase